MAVEEDAPTNPALEEDTRVMVQVCMSASPLTISDVTLSGIPVNLKNAPQPITSYLCNAGIKGQNGGPCGACSARQYKELAINSAAVSIQLQPKWERRVDRKLRAFAHVH